MHSFQWVNDFSAARQFSFEQATGTWRMYLDADDTLEYRGPSVVHNGVKLKETIRGISERNPQVNAISFPYLYVEGDTRQNVVRCVRWADGWKWEDPVHESLIPKGRQRYVAGVSDLVVVHHKDPADFPKAFARNQVIIEKWLETPNLEPLRKAKALFHLAGDAFNHGLHDEADKIFTEVATIAEHTNYYGLAQNERVRCAVLADNLPHALAVASEHATRYPNDRDGFLRMGWIYALMDRWEDAATLFEDAQRREDKTQFAQADDEWLTKGLVPVLWATALIKQGNLDKAGELLSSVPPITRNHQMVRARAVEASRALMRAVGLARLMEFVDYLIWDTEPTKALEVLERFTPAAIAPNPIIGQRIRALKAKLPHLKGWKEYQDAYASIPAETYHTEDGRHSEVLQLFRATVLLEWAKSLPKEGPPIEMAAIGFQDGTMEDAVLSANPRITMTVCDVAPQSNKGLSTLREKWPGRIKSHAIVRDHYDWTDRGGVFGFDCVTLFEVIEHVPSDLDALKMLRLMLKPDGVLFISTPVADAWVESYLTDPKTGPAWYGHVRAHNHVSFPKAFESQGLTGDLYEGWDGTFVAKLRRKTTLPKNRVSILVPSTLTPFDADTLYQKHLGGSEECVVHLAEAMAAAGWAVSVFAPVPKRDDEPMARILRHRDGVNWRPVEEFDPLDPNHENVLFWRCPGVNLPQPAPYRSLLWLHDASYGVSPDAYKKFDKVIILSEHHRKCLEKYDGFNDHIRTVMLSNGIKAEGFPEMWGDRDPHKIIYASSPDRGLELLLKSWKRVREFVPDATLDIFYDWALFKKIQPEAHAAMLALLTEVSESAGGIVYHGGVAQPTLHEAFRRSAVWAYPHFVNTEIETFCITGIKALASGCLPITSEHGALPEILDQFGIRTTEANFEEKLIAELRSGNRSTDYRRRMRNYALEKFDWTVVAKRFLDMMSTKQ